MQYVPIVAATEVPELLVIGGLILAGYIAHSLGRFIHVPRVTILLVLGILAGPFGLNVIPKDVAEWFPEITDIALAMVGFLLGESFAGREIKRTGPTVLAVSLGETLGAAIVVFVAAYLMLGNMVIALLLAGIAPASDPAASLDVVRENKADGPLTKTVLGVVAIDDAWGVILFSFLLVFAETLSGQSSGVAGIGHGLWDVFGAILLGILFGVPMAWLTGRIKKGEPSVLEASGIVFICAGVAKYLDVSYLLTCIVLGATVANRAKHHTRPFRDIEGASEPFLVMFFLLAGYECDLASLQTLGLLGIAYVIARSVGLIAGGGLAARWVNAPEVVQKRVGWCLLPQAGVALGLALMVSERLPDTRSVILPLAISTTVVFEIIGPLVTRWQLKQAGEYQST
ncbi:MAG: cation:proton antiporter [Planctomycetaceae bacterium]